MFGDVAFWTLMAVVKKGPLKRFSARGRMRLWLNLLLSGLSEDERGYP